MKYEITEEAILKAANECPDTKKVLKILFPDAFSEIQYEQGKIYIVISNFDGALFKLHEFGKEWMFCEMNSSECGHSGTHDTAQKAINNIDGCKLQVFDNEKEFYKWAVKQLS